MRSTYRTPSKTARGGRRHGQPMLTGVGQEGGKHRLLGIAKASCLRQALARKLARGEASTLGVSR